MVGLLYGSGLRLLPTASAQRLEALMLEAKDPDFQSHGLTVRDGRATRTG